MVLQSFNDLRKEFRNYKIINNEKIIFTNGNFDGFVLPD
jgi:hypothetical protein